MSFYFDSLIKKNWARPAESKAVRNDFSKLKSVLEDPQIKIIGKNAKFPIVHLELNFFFFFSLNEKWISPYKTGYIFLFVYPLIYLFKFTAKSAAEEGHESSSKSSKSLLKFIKKKKTKKEKRKEASNQTKRDADKDIDEAIKEEDTKSLKTKKKWFSKGT